MRAGATVVVKVGVAMVVAVKVVVAMEVGSVEATEAVVMAGGD